MMLRMKLVIFVIGLGYSADDTGASEESGLSNYWTDNHKAFHQIYGKTSDLEIYGETLPLSVTYGGTEVQKFKKSDAMRSQSDNKPSHRSHKSTDTAVAGTDESPYEFPNSYPQLLGSRKRIKNNIKNDQRVTKYGAYFTPDDSIDSLKSANGAIDPATLDYIKQFEHLDTQQAIDFPQESIVGFKPYASLTYRNLHNQPILTDSYKSIQDIIDANDGQEDEVFERQKANHELAHKAYGYIPKIKFEGVDNSPTPQMKPNKPGFKFVPGNDISKKPSMGRCSSRGCRKPTPRVRFRKSRPRITKVKHRIITSNL